MASQEGEKEVTENENELTIIEGEGVAAEPPAPLAQLPPPGLASRLIQATAAIEPLIKDGVHEYHKYRYPTVAQVREHANRALAQAGISIIPSIVRVARSERTGAKGTAISISVVELEIAVCSEDGCYLARWIGESEDTGDKGVQKAASAALKAWLTQLLLIGAREEENDDGATEAKRARKSRKPAKSQPAKKSHQPAPKPAPEPAPSKHWCKNDLTRQAFWEWTRITLSLSDKEVFRILGVERLDNYPGSPGDARSAISAFLDTCSADQDRDEVVENNAIQAFLDSCTDEQAEDEVGGDDGDVS